MIKKTLCFVVSFLLIGCAGVGSDFSCNATATGSCQTMTEANKISKQKNSNIKLISSQQEPKKDVKTVLTLIDIIGEATPNRTTEKVYKIWIAPYVDDKDNFHREQTIFFTSEPTRWVGFE